MSNDLHLFESFTKGKKTATTSSRNCVIYTRVSTKEQADNNMSLETQRKACEAYANKSGYHIAGYFGGTYESAKTDERKEFNNMLSFVKRSKEKIAYIIVYSVDRFSRSGTNAMYIADQLKKAGILVYAVTQPTDTTTVSGRLQQNIQFIFSEYDNQLRREKCMAGVKEKLLQGIWCTSPPLGYNIVRRNGKKEFVINQTGKLLRKGFEWKAEGVSNEEVRARLAARGLKLDNQRISDFLRNPFYCGLLVHNALEGKIVEGVQEKVASKELFLKVNGILSQNHQGYNLKPENENIPLKRFLKCDDCGNYLRAYKAAKNQQYYYKCNTPGCKCNKRADNLHSAFKTLLNSYTVDVNEDHRTIIRLQMIATYNLLTAEGRAQQEQLHKQLAEVDRKLQRLKERFAMEEIDREIYEEFKPRLLEERKNIEQELLKFKNGVSNLEKCVDECITYASKLASLWDLGDYGEKQQLQFLLFPEGILYNRKNDTCRTPRVNEVFRQIAAQASDLHQIKSGNKTFYSYVPAFVV
ncbi:recombinase family protein [Chitinophaga sp. 212800010-3]|uniref:recombinase family protein n=1 Tax=unclassified Chitinophaga TaxID=2619133 RepID=UPI002E0FE141